MTLDNKNKLKVLSLFSCCGGLDLGLEGGFQCFRRQLNEEMHPDWIERELDKGKVLLKENAFETVFANDIDVSAFKTWTKFFQDKHVKNQADYIIGSIVELVKRAKDEDDSFAFPQVDIITGGFPCCDFSVSGKRQGFNSTKSDTEANIDAPTPENRGMLYYWMKEVVELVEPKLFIAENVKGLTNLGDSQQIIEEDFRNTGEAGYVVIPARVIHSGDYGVAQNRERVFFFGFNKKYLSEEGLAALTAEDIESEFDPYPMPTHDYTQRGAEGRKPFFNVSEAFAGLKEPDEEESDPSQMVYSKAKFLEKGQGQTEVKLDGVGPTIRSKHHGNIEFRRLSKAHGGKHDQELANGLEERRMTVRECARIQSFPDDYEFVIKGNKEHAVSASAAYVLVGNAVPPVLAYNIARSIMEKWDLWF